MELLLLLLSSLFLLVISLKINRYDMWNPVSLFFLFWCISLVSAIYLLPIYNVEIDLSFVLFVLIGLISFFIGGNILHSTKINNNKTPLEAYFLDNRKKLFTDLSLFIIITVIYIIIIKYYLSQIEIVMRIGMEINEALNAYKQTYIQGDIEIPFYIRQLSRLSTVLTYFFVFSLARTLILKKSLINPLLCIYGLFLFFFSAIVQATRTYIVYLVVAFIIYVITLYIRKNRKYISLKINIYIYSVAFVFIAFFGFLGNLMGRPDQEYIFETVSFYFASGILGFSQALRFNDIQNFYFFGEATFSGIWRCINDYMIPISIGYTQPFFYLNGINLGNTYTSFYRYYTDFGIAGLIIIPLFISYFFSIFYDKIINKNCSFMIFILYGYSIYGIVFFAYDELLLSKQLSFGLLSDLVYFYLIKWIFFKE